MKNQKGFAPLTLLIPAAIILIGLVAFGRFYYLPKVNENQNANSNQNTNGTIVVNGNLNVNSNANANTSVNLNMNTTVDETKDWESVIVDKSYWGDSFPGTFTIKYPESWKESKSLGGYRISNKESSTYGLGAQTDDIFIFSLRWQKRSSETDLAEACQSYNDSNLTRKIANTKDTMVSGIIAYEFDYTVSAAARADARQACLFNGDYILIFLGNKLESSLISYYDKILSTFQFTDEMAGWKTHNSTTYKYQIKYPDNWFTKSCSEAYTAFASEEKRLPPCETEAWGDVQISVNADTPATYYQEDITQTKAYMNVTLETDITVGGINAKRLAGTTKAMEGPGPAEGTEEIYVVFLTSDNELYHLVYYKNTTTNYSDIFDQMVSTFTFVD